MIENFSVAEMTLLFSFQVFYCSVKTVVPHSLNNWTLGGITLDPRKQHARCLPKKLMKKRS